MLEAVTRLQFGVRGRENLFDIRNSHYECRYSLNGWSIIRSEPIVNTYFPIKVVLAMIAAIGLTLSVSIGAMLPLTFSVELVHIAGVALACALLLFASFAKVQVTIDHRYISSIHLIGFSSNHKVETSITL